MIRKKKERRFEELIGNKKIFVANPIKNESTLIKNVKDTPPAPFKKFINPTNKQGWTEFHQINENGMAKAYASKDGYHIDENNRLFIAGSKTRSDMVDWLKLPFNKFSESSIYKTTEKVMNEHPEITYLCGHSSGGSAILEYEKRTDRDMTTVTYGAPVKEGPDVMMELHPDNRPLRFAHLGDVVASLDRNKRYVLKAPQIDEGALLNIKKAIVEPTPSTVYNGIKNGLMKVDPMMGLHSMDGYAKPDGIIDFVKSGIAMNSAAKTLL